MSWDEARAIAQRLIDAGHEAVFAGGCVRDRLLDRPVADIDIATSATPDEVDGLFERTVAVGKAFGVMLVVGEDATYDVATFRRDVGVGDGRRPAAIEPSTLEEDVLRRDFTINGLVQDPRDDTLIDHVGGRADLAARRVRAIGDPDLRFEEDGLRLLRAVRFAARLDFAIEAQTGAAMTRAAARLSAVSGERIGDEVSKMLGDPGRARAHALLAEHGLLSRTLPGVPAPDVAPGVHAVLAALAPDASARSALAVLVDGGAPVADVAARRRLARELMEHLRRSRDDTQHVTALVEDVDALDHLEATGADVAAWRRLLATRHADDLLAWRRARDTVEGRRSPSLATVERLRERYGDELAVVPRPLLDGDTLAELGVERGPALGLATRALVDAQLRDEVTDVDAARAFVARWLASGGGERPHHES